MTDSQSLTSRITSLLTSNGLAFHNLTDGPPAILE